MATPILLFANGDLANRPVAGIPAAARAARALLRHDDDANVRAIQISAPDGWQPSIWCREEFERLLPHARVEAVSLRSIEAGTDLCLIDAVALLEGAINDNCHFASPSDWLENVPDTSRNAKNLDRIGRAIVKSTGKASDGLVSRYLNRPISRIVSRALLTFRGIRPVHATALAALTGVVMAACLLVGGENGLVLGALLFHAASVIDGVDGEIARATFRSSDFGAKLDTITDGITNLAFLSFASLNLALQGNILAASYGAMGLGLLTAGLAALGLRSRAMGGRFTFDVVKDKFRARNSRLSSFVAAITSRDAYAAAFAIAFAAGFAEQALLIFAVAATIWLATVLWVLARMHSAQS